jgi:hypothetical protein
MKLSALLPVYENWEKARILSSVCQYKRTLHKIKCLNTFWSHQFFLNILIVEICWCLEFLLWNTQIFSFFISDGNGYTREKFPYVFKRRIKCLILLSFWLCCFVFSVSAISHFSNFLVVMLRVGWMIKGTCSKLV